METKLCKHCQTEIPKKAKVCPNCRKKQGGIGKWIIVALVAFLLIGMMGGSDDSSDKDSGNSSSGNNTSNVASESELSEKDNELTKADMYMWIAENATTSFEIQEPSIIFINEHETFFPGSDDNKGAISDFVNWEADYPHLAKNINKYTGELFAIGGYVVDIEETDDGITAFQIYSYGGDSYIFYYLGVLDEVFEETEVYVYALPMDMVTFENMGGAYTEAIVGAACYVQTEFYD